MSLLLAEDGRRTQLGVEVVLQFPRCIALHKLIERLRRGRVEVETVAAMTRVITQIVAEVRMPFGVNVLRNDALSALAIAAATGAAFIRVNVHTGAMLTDQGIIEGDAYATLRKRASLAPNVLIFADHLVKHATPLAEVDPIQSARDLRLRGLADALSMRRAHRPGMRAHSSAYCSIEGALSPLL